MSQVNREVTIELNVVAGQKNAAVTQAMISQVEQANKSQVDSEKTAVEVIVSRHTDSARKREEVQKKVTKAHLETIAEVERAEKEAHAERLKRESELQKKAENFDHSKIPRLFRAIPPEDLKAGGKKFMEDYDKGLTWDAETPKKGKKEKTALAEAESQADEIKKFKEEAAKQLAEAEVRLAKVAAAEKSRIDDELTRKQKLNAQEVLTASGKALKGMTSIVQGAAALGVVGNENLEQMLRTLVAIQATGSIAKGAIDVATNAKAAVGAGGAGLAAAGAIGLGATEGIQAVRRALGDTSEASESFVGALISWRKAAKDAAESTSKLEAAEEGRRKRLAQQQADNRQITQQSQFSATVRGERESIVGRLDAVSGDETAQAERARLRALAEVERSEAEIAAARERAIARQQRGEFALVEDKLQAEDRFKTAIEQRANAEQRVFEITKARLETQKSIVEQAKSELESAKQAAESEEQRVQSRLAGFAKLGRGEQARLREAAQKFQQGGADALTQADIDLLERTGQGAGVVQAVRSREGADAGGEDVFRAFGELEGRDVAIRRRDELTASLAEKQADQLKIDEELAKAKRRYVDALLKQSEALERTSESQGQQLGIEGPISGSPAAMQAAFGEIRQAIIDSIRGVAQDVRRSQESAAAMRE